MFKLINNGQIEYYISDIFPKNVKHAFTTKRIFNEDKISEDFTIARTNIYRESELPEKNRKILCSALNLNNQNLIMTDQQHTDNIFEITSPITPEFERTLECTDAVILSVKDIPVMLFFADCTPVMIYDTKQHILALIHAGWKGTAKKIAYKSALKLIESYKSSADNLIAAIGPSIGKCCYEVSDEVAKNLIETIPQNVVSDKMINYKSSKPVVDLKRINEAQLRSAGILQVDILDECTCCKHNQFFSYRKSNGQTGRQALIAQLS